jgi:hypothetical protein
MKEEDRRREEEERRREQLFRAIEQLIYTAYLQSLSLPAVRRAIEQKKDDFFFENNHTANRQVERVLGVMADRLNGILLNGIRREWEFSKEVLEARVEAQLDPSTRDRMLRDRLRIDATQSSRIRSADAFVREKQRDGLNLSGRVWNLAGNAQKEIEVILQNAIKEGRRGTEIAKDLRRFLIEPNKLFRRVRNKETGALELSAAAKAYHPGQGVYRSSYKNALRMARTELKAAQCEAAWQSAQTNPLIVGWEIRLSNNHTTLRDGKPCPFHDMCDELQGVYPKAFRFRGWHPHCRCEMLPIIARPSDRKELYRRIFKGDAKERASWSPRAVEEVPQVFTDWVEKNRARARGWRTLPRFITDNPAYIVGEYGRPKPRPVEVPPGFLDFEDPRKSSRKREKTKEEQSDIRRRWNSRKEYNAYGDDVKRILFDHDTGGYVVAHASRIAHGETSENEERKLNKELRMAKVYAQNGYRVEMLGEADRDSAPDVLINGIKGDFKSTGSSNNIVKYAKKAFQKQGADIVLFEIDAMTRDIYSELLKAKKKGGRVFYYTKEDEIVHEL